MQTIKFINVFGVPEEYSPVPADKIIPDWYKELETYINGEKVPVTDRGGTTATAKKCMPMFDAITAGYIISTHTDLFVSQRLNQHGQTVPFFEWSSFDAISFHAKEQLPKHPNDTGHDFHYPKWSNSWGIKTPSGYSTLFIPPLHRENEIIVFSGVVDTDTYTAPVTFPFVLKNPKMEGLIPAGTPIMQVIPFKRDEWKMELGREEDLIEQDKVTARLKAKFFDGYKTQFRQKKEYK
jgi:hypothetical protein